MEKKRTGIYPAPEPENNIADRPDRRLSTELTDTQTGREEDLEDDEIIPAVDTEDE